MKLTAKLRQAIATNVEAGVSREDAAAAAAVPVAEFAAWLVNGAEDRQDGKRSAARTLLENVESAEALVRVKAGGDLNRHAATNWEAAAHVRDQPPAGRPTVGTLFSGE